MPRHPAPRKIGNNPEENIKKGIILIRKGVSIRKASKTVEVPFATLKRYYNNTKHTCLEEQRLQPNYTVNKVFNDDQESELKDYINYCAQIFYGLTSKECRQLAYQCAKKNHLKMPAAWEQNEMAGKCWLLSFRRRHNLTIRRPEPCSLSRATAFNEHNVAKFFDNLEDLVKRSPAFADGTRIFNLDETSTTTVQKPQRVITAKGKKCVGKVTSGERGTLVTTCCIIGAGGIAAPPVMVFPRKNFKDHMIKNTPPGTLGLATPTGWMNSTIFPEVIKHFIKFTNASKENPCILIMDNHESHLCLEALELAKNSGVHILTLHPHTSGKLQPLDVGIYGPFKMFYNAAIDSWLMRHPGKPITIYDLGEIIGTAFQKVMTPHNITKAFSKCGIYPFDRLIFTEEDFMPSSVTDRPCHSCAPREEGLNSSSVVIPLATASNPTAQTIEEPGTTCTTAKIIVDAVNCTSSSQDLSQPETFMPNSLCSTKHASTGTGHNTPSRKSIDSPNVTQPDTLQNQALRSVSRLYCGTSRDSISNETIVEACKHIPKQQEPETIILSVGNSETPNSLTPPSKNSEASQDNQIRATVSKSTSKFISPFEFRDPIKAAPRKDTRKRRKAGRSIIATDTPEKLLLEQEKHAKKQKKTAKTKKIIRKVLQSDDEEEFDDFEMQLDDSDEYSDEEDHQDGESTIVFITEKHLEKPLPRPPDEGDYIIVQFVTKRLKSYYIGKVLEGRNEDLEYYVSFLRRKRGTERFNLPDKPDLSVVKENDIKFILPKPSMVGTSSRPFYAFPIDLSSLKLR